jgi:hypothetical protein
MDGRQLRRIERRRALRRRRLAVALTVLSSLLAVTLIGCRPTTAANRMAQVSKPKPDPHVPWRPPQFVVVSFDGAGVRGSGRTGGRLPAARTPTSPFS